MNPAHDLDGLYQEASRFLKDKDYDRAADLLRQILVADEDYRDASALLARAIRLKRRRWYTDLRLWGALAAIALVVAAILIATRLRPTAASPAAGVSSDATAIALAAPTPTLPAWLQQVREPTLAPTPVPLAWRRVSMPDQWTQPNVTTIAVDPTDADVIYVGTYNAGIYKTIDGGLSWAPVHDGLGRASIGALAINPDNPNIVYAGTNQGGVYKSRDGGASWLAVNSGLHPRDFRDVTLLQIDPENLAHLYLVDAGILYETNDAGGSWRRVHEAPPGCPGTRHFAVSPADFDILYVQRVGPSTRPDCPPAGLYKSNDGGRTWALTSMPMTQGFGGRVWVGGPGGHTVFAKVEVSGVSGEGRLYRSDDEGGTWTQITWQKGCGRMWIDPRDAASAVCGGYVQISKTTDGGRSWTSLGLDRIEIGVIARLPDGRLLAAGEGFYVSDDEGAHWEARNSGLGGESIQLMADPAIAKNIYGWALCYGGGTSPLYRSTDGASTWPLVTDQGCDLVLDASGQMLFRSANQAILQSADRGSSWHALPSPIHSGFRTLDPVVGVDPLEPRRLLAFHSEPESEKDYYSTDGGATWSHASGVPERMFFPRLFFATAGEATPGQSPIPSTASPGAIVYAVPDTGDGMARSMDRGVSWERCAAFPGITLSDFDQRLAIDPRDPQHIFVATHGAGILESDDGCRALSPNTTGLSSLFVNTLAIDPNSPDTIYAATDGGAHVSFDGGGHWNEINEGLLGATVEFSIVVDVESNVYAATPYGIFTLEGR